MILNPYTAFLLPNITLFLTKVASKSGRKAMEGDTDPNYFTTGPRQRFLSSVKKYSSHLQIVLTISVPLLNLLLSIMPKANARL